MLIRLSPVPKTETVTMTVVDQKAIASEAYVLAESNEPIAPFVKEALDVIDAALDEYGCALICATLCPFTNG
jgi:hypothetical protein